MERAARHPTWLARWCWVSVQPWGILAASRAVQATTPARPRSSACCRHPPCLLLPLITWLAGTPATPAPGAPTAGTSNITVACAAVPGATKYTIRATRTGTTGVTPIERTVTEEARAAAGGKLTVELSGASDGLAGRGKWKVQVKASNEYAPAASTPPIKHTPSESGYSALSAEVVVGLPQPVTISSLAGSSPGKAALVFTCVRDGGSHRQPSLLRLGMQAGQQPCLAVAADGAALPCAVVATRGASQARPTAGAPATHACRAPAVNAEVGANYTAVVLTAAGAATTVPAASVTPGSNTLTLLGGAYTLRLDAKNAHTTGNGLSTLSSGAFFVGGWRSCRSAPAVTLCVRELPQHKHSPPTLPLQPPPSPLSSPLLPAP